MKKFLIFGLIVGNLAIGVQGFSAMTTVEKAKLIEQIDNAYDREDKNSLINLISKYIKEYPNDANYLNKLGVVYDEKENYVEAEKYYLKAIEKGNIYAIRNIGKLYFNQNEYEKAIKYLKEFIEIAEDVNLYSWIGDSYAELQNYEEAKKWYLKALNRDGYEENKLGITSENEGNQKEAIKWYLKSAEKGNTYAMRNLSVIYYNLESYKEAKSWAEKGLRLEKVKEDLDKELIDELQELINEINEL